MIIESVRPIQFYLIENPSVKNNLNKESSHIKREKFNDSPEFNKDSTASSESETPVCLLHHFSSVLSYSKLPHDPRWQLESSNHIPTGSQKKENSQKGKKKDFPSWFSSL